MTREEFETYRFGKSTKVIIGGGDWEEITAVDFEQGLVYIHDFMSPFLEIPYQDITQIKD